MFRLIVFLYVVVINVNLFSVCFFLLVLFCFVFRLLMYYSPFLKTKNVQPANKQINKRI